MMLMQIFSHTPLWVWALLAGLLALGLMQTRHRHVRPAAVLALPLCLGLLGLWSLVGHFVGRPLLAVVWLLALVAAAQVGLRLKTPAGVSWLAQQQRLQMPGSWMPMVLIVSIFSLRYANGVAQAMHPQWAQQLQFQLPMALAFGLLSGLFWGRAWRLWSLTQRVPLAAQPTGH